MPSDPYASSHVTPYLKWLSPPMQILIQLNGQPVSTVPSHRWGGNEANSNLPEIIPTGASSILPLTCYLLWRILVCSGILFQPPHRGEFSDGNKGAFAIADRNDTYWQIFMWVVARFLWTGIYACTSSNAVTGSVNLVLPDASKLKRKTNFSSKKQKLNFKQIFIAD